MTFRTRPLIATAIASAAAALLFASPRIFANDASAGCRPAHGLFEDHVVTPPPTLTTAGRELGTLHGDLHFALVNETPSLTPNVAFYDAQSSIHTDDGDLNFDEAGSIDNSNGNFAVLQTVVGGTGRYQGATGQLFAHGSFNFATGQGHGSYEGTVCTQ